MPVYQQPEVQATHKAWSGHKTVYFTVDSMKAAKDELASLGPVKLRRCTNLQWCLLDKITIEVSKRADTINWEIWNVLFFNHAVGGRVGCKQGDLTGRLPRRYYAKIPGTQFGVTSNLAEAVPSWKGSFRGDQLNCDTELPQDILGQLLPLLREYA